MATKKQKRDEAILMHGLKLMRLFGLQFPNDRPVELCKTLHRIEAKEHRRAEDECNGYLNETEEQQERHDKRVLDRLDSILGFRAKGIPVFVNGDPRGHALKVEEEYMRTHPEFDLPKDWGGYGILVPEF